MGAERTISLEELAAGLGSVIQQAEAGVTTLVTRDGRPLLRIAPALGELAEHTDLVARAQALRATLGDGETAAQMIHEARRDSGRL